MHFAGPGRLSNEGIPVTLNFAFFSPITLDLLAVSNGRAVV